MSINTKEFLVDLSVAIFFLIFTLSILISIGWSIAQFVLWILEVI